MVSPNKIASIWYTIGDIKMLPEHILKLLKSVNFYFPANTNMSAVGSVWGRSGERTQSEKNWWIWEMDSN